jgi:hypothetical protein
MINRNELLFDLGLALWAGADGFGRPEARADQALGVQR